MDRSSNVCCDNDERVHLPSCCSKCLYEWVVFGGHCAMVSVWKYVVAIGESMNCMTFGGVGVKGGWRSMGAPNTHSMSGMSLARHVHWSNHCGTVMFGV
jgi:hypothetical protein